MRCGPATVANGRGRFGRRVNHRGTEKDRIQFSRHRPPWSLVFKNCLLIFSVPLWFISYFFGFTSPLKIAGSNGSAASVFVGRGGTVLLSWPKASPGVAGNSGSFRGSAGSLAAGGGSAAAVPSGERAKRAQASRVW